MSSLECKVEEVFKITGRGYVLTLILNDSDVSLKIVDTLRYQSNEKTKIEIKGIEILNYGSNIKNIRKDIIGILVDLSEEQALNTKGKILIKHI
ncbi:hypothetical protein [Paenibacillus sp. PAMC21692]|uniref:hypothetical protein n=1 Tax=Paenibacillus sp. PAMC21692 TaxID=2762320 RepID=UPI00164ED130|nr:hypothetical protein [Paenibacillus sp. PAMC21692]QNK55154.1 hypothetical protein H7F31_21315 [Paenibacillus sp. PAMC21692]